MHLGVDGEGCIGLPLRRMGRQFAPGHLCQQRAGGDAAVVSGLLRKSQPSSTDSR
jgi:hypothetical protein